jgi:hypothetical protein
VRFEREDAVGAGGGRVACRQAEQRGRNEHLEPRTAAAEAHGSDPIEVEEDPTGNSAAGSNEVSARVD